MLLVGGLLMNAVTLGGFSVAGITSSSVASLWQSMIGNVTTGSMFAVLQSLGASGTFSKGALAVYAGALVCYLSNLPFAQDWWETVKQQATDFASFTKKEAGAWSCSAQNGAESFARSVSEFSKSTWKTASKYETVRQAGDIL
mmetsp:Transcript_1584/g.3311  ORF Transcript_1584/g.3311 Transcript_1584/m.3311 type:complete len:143 (+) Transcript_1584:133-561(+)